MKRTNLFLRIWKNHIGITGFQLKTDVNVALIVTDCDVRHSVTRPVVCLMERYNFPHHHKGDNLWLMYLLFLIN